MKPHPFILLYRSDINNFEKIIKPHNITRIIFSLSSIFKMIKHHCDSAMTNADYGLVTFLGDVYCSFHFNLQAWIGTRKGVAAR